jgi:hypothetical protein
MSGRLSCRSADSRHDLSTLPELSLLAFVSALCHALRMSIKHTKSEKSQKADELEKRLEDRPEQNEKKDEREDSSRADIDSVRH